jgi:cytochrome c553
MVNDLDDKAIADVAAYYSHLVRGSVDPQRAPFVDEEIQNLVMNGDATRSLPPCVACHGERAGGPIEIPTLTHQFPEYLQAQLKAFATGARHNDIYHRMRSVASRLTDREMMMLGLYYYGTR